LEENKCLEIIAVEGRAQEARCLVQVPMAKRGVKQVEVATIGVLSLYMFNDSLFL